jgi:hypothetical protein
LRKSQPYADSYSYSYSYGYSYGYSYSYSYSYGFAERDANTVGDPASANAKAAAYAVPSADAVGW